MASPSRWRLMVSPRAHDLHSSRVSTWCRRPGTWPRGRGAEPGMSWRSQRGLRLLQRVPAPGCTARCQDGCDVGWLEGVRRRMAADSAAPSSWRAARRPCKPLSCRGGVGRRCADRAWSACPVVAASCSRAGAVAASIRMRSRRARSPRPQDEPPQSQLSVTACSATSSSPRSSERERFERLGDHTASRPRRAWRAASAVVGGRGCGAG